VSGISNQLSLVCKATLAKQFPVEVVLLLSLLVSLLTLPAFGQTFNTSTDFSIDNGNPNGTWSYGYETSLGGTLNLYDVTSDGANASYWNSSVIDVAQTPSDYKVTGAGNPYGSPGDTIFHPGPDDEISVYRWTAPSSESIDINAIFQGRDGGGSIVDVLHDGTTLFNADVNGTGDTHDYDGTTSVASGDTIDFAVGLLSGFGYNSTYVDGTITVAPEPSTLALSALGSIGGLLMFRRRK